MSKKDDDTQLFLATLNGDELAACKLYDKHKPAVVRYIYLLHRDVGMTIDFDECSSIFDEMFAVALATYNPYGAPFKSYLYNITRNCCFTHSRKRFLQNNTVELDKEIKDSENPVSSYYGKKDSNFSSCYEMVFCSPEFESLSLTETQKVVLYLRIEGYKYKEISEATGIPISSVRRIIEKLKNSHQLHKLILEMD